MGRKMRNDLTGKIFGRLLVLGRAADYISLKGAKQQRWKCECECGNIVIVQKSALLYGATESCGCWHKEVVREIVKETGRKNSRYYDKEYGDERV